jgi:hypothetical protein
VNKENMQLWVQALESGQYKQGQNSLARETKASTWYKPWTWSDTKTRYCCLGVACEVARQNGVNLPKTTRYETVRYGKYATMTLPAEVVQWLDVASSDPYVAPGTSAVAANDELRWSFAKIAAELRKMYLTEENNETEEENG